MGADRPPGLVRPPCFFCRHAHAEATVFCSGPQGRPVDWIPVPHLPRAADDASKLHSPARNSLGFTEAASLTPGADKAFVTTKDDGRKVVVAVRRMKQSLFHVM